MPPLGKRKRPSPTASSSLPITAFFERKRPASEVAGASSASNSQSDSLAERDAVEEIEDDGDSADEVTVVATIPDERSARRKENRVLNTAHLTRLLHRRELGPFVRGVPSSSVARRRQQIDQRLARHALTQFQLLPLQLAIPGDTLRSLQLHRAVSVSDEFYASCLAFDSQGALLVAGSSNGVIALYDCDDLFHHTINLQQRSMVSTDDKPATIPRELHPIHIIYPGLEVQRLRWNPSNEDEIACCFLNRNEIHVYNLQKFPTKPGIILKTASRPSSGYTDLVFVRATAPPPSRTNHKLPRGGTIIAGDIDGNLRAWDLRFPTKPLWAVSTTFQAVTSLALSHDQKLLVCGTEGGAIVTYDIHRLVTPAFGSKPMPQRKTVIRLADSMRGCLSPDAAGSLKQALQASPAALAIASLYLLPTSTTQLVVQLRNQWLVVLDLSTSAVLKLHTPVKESPLAAIRSAAHALPASVLHSASQEHHTQQHHSSQRHSWLHLHRCTASPLFYGSMVCTGTPHEPVLSVVDLHRLDLLRATKSATPSPSLLLNNSMQLMASDPQDHVERLSRFRIDTQEPVTAVAVHPTQHWIVCGGAFLKLRVLSAVGSRDEEEETSTEVIDEE